MRGRKPRPIEVAPEDLPVLQQIAQSQTRPWYQVRCARILLGIAEGGRTQTLAFQTQCNESTVRRTCHRYERLGLSDLLDSPPRSGRPIAISPLQRAQIVELACLEPVAEGLHITHWTSEDLARQAVADGIVPAISARTVRRILHDVRLATPPDPLLEDSSPGSPVQAAGRAGPLVLRQRRPPGQAGLLGGLRR